jgi:hypothetical protein
MLATIQFRIFCLSALSKNVIKIFRIGAFCGYETWSPALREGYRLRVF